MGPVRPPQRHIPRRVVCRLWVLLMRPKRWIDPSEDRHVREGDLRIVRLASGRVRATKWVWRDYYDTIGCYAGSDGEPIGDVVAVGVTWACAEQGTSTAPGTCSWCGSRDHARNACDNDPPNRLGEVPARKRSGPSGPSGKNLVQKRAIRIPDDLWSRFGTVAAEQKSDRNTIVNQLVREYCDRVTR